MADFTLGIEEEFQIIDPVTRDLKAHITEMIDEGQMILGEQVKPEMHQSMIEVGTGICANVQEARTDVIRLRRVISELAAKKGLRIAAASTHPFSDWETSQITPNERYYLLIEEMQHVARSLLIFGMHVHVGIDDRDDYGFLREFIAAVAAAGCRTFVVHARKAILSGLSPKENREIPPLLYATVYRLKADFPELRILLNGGVDTLAAIHAHLSAGVDGVMIGRKAYADPYWLTAVEANVLDQTGVWQPPSRAEVVRAMMRYAQQEMGEWVRLHHITRHMLGLYHGQPGARAWRRFLSTRGCALDARPELLLESLQMVAGEDAGF